MLPLIFSYLPIVLLIYLMTRKNSLPSHKALPLTAAVLYGVMLIVFKRDPNGVHAAILDGLLTAWTPILIIAGAIFLFRTMETVGALSVLRDRLNAVSENRIAQLMIVGWAFPFIIEGASGFGTPAAIAAPILVGLGFPAVGVTVLVLVMNSVPVSFGGVGTPTWFGFSELSLTPTETLEIAFKSAVMNGAAAFVVPPVALLFVVHARSVLRNLPFILLSVAATVAPYILTARYSYEFPSLVGGTVGLLATVVLAKFGIGLSGESVPLRHIAPPEGAPQRPVAQPAQPETGGSLLKASFPLWGTLLLLIITRVPALGIKQLLTLAEPSAALSLGTLGTLRVSPALVVSLTDIFTTDSAWTHALLYVPSLVPFGVISWATLALYGRTASARGVLTETASQLRTPVLALMGALVFVNLMMMGGDTAAVVRIGHSLAHVAGDGWQLAAPLLGAVGSFFSGSNTVSNLTFGAVQDAVAQELGLNRTTVLAMQSVGGAMGNMVCINNIVAVVSVLALGNIEGFILKRTARVMLLYAAIASGVGLLL